jgi:hypothetical protein
VKEKEEKEEKEKEEKEKEEKEKEEEKEEEKEKIEVKTKETDEEAKEENNTTTTSENTTNVGSNILSVETTNEADRSPITPPRQISSSSDAPTPGGEQTPPVQNIDNVSSQPNCPHCGDNFVELARMPRPRRRRRLARLQRRRDERRNEAMHIQALLSALRSSIVNQLEEAELNMAMRQSMENYQPNMSPACKMSINSLVDFEILKGKSCDVKISPTGVTTTVDQLSDEACPICAEDFAVGDKVAKLPMCQHSFHSPCVKKWFEVNNTCPICRSILPAKCQTCIDNQIHTKEMQDQAEEARRLRSESNASNNGGGGESDGSDERENNGTVSNIESTATNSVNSID